MTIIGLLNIGSLLLGLIAWGIPIVLLVRKPIPHNFFQPLIQPSVFLLVL